MSYCRWSSDNTNCDLYCYEDCSGGFTTHVAGFRLRLWTRFFYWLTDRRFKYKEIRKADDNLKLCQLHRERLNSDEKYLLSIIEHRDIRKLDPDTIDKLEEIANGLR